MAPIVSGVRGQVPATMAYWDFGPNSGYTEQVLIDNIAGTPALALQDGDKDLNGKAGLPYADQAGRVDNAGGGAYIYNSDNITFENW